jgi:large repetitive protein
MRGIWRALMSAVFLVCGSVVVDGQTLVWDANTEPDIAGYRLFYGTQSGSYPNEVYVGNQTQYTPPAGFDWSRTLYFAVKAYNTSGLSSPFSNEVQWTPPSLPATVTSLQASSAYPLLAGLPVTWTASATGSSPIEYRFYMYRKTGWVLAKDYSPDNTLTWTPSTVDDAGSPYAVQVWARRVGSSAQYESWLGTPTFSVTGAALDLFADVDFPTPPGNQVTWKALAAFAYEGTLEYQFLLANEQDGVFSVLRGYHTSNLAEWTPTQTGRYAVQVRARRVGSTADFEYVGTTAFFDVALSPLSVTALTADLAPPVTTGTTVTWTARVRGGTSGPIQYQFWVYSAGSGWKLGQAYSSSQTFMWTPTIADEGDNVVQVWVRSNGSTAAYEAWRSSPPFRVNLTPMTLTTNTLFPAAPGSHITWTADVPDTSGALEYQFWVYAASSGNWSLARDYGDDPTFVWIPTETGDYRVEARARHIGSTAAYETRRNTNALAIAQGPVQIASITSNSAFPAPPGSAITWTVAASGGSAGPLEYQFWRMSNGVWILVQTYGPLNSYTWTPTAADIGDHALQVWVRSAGSTAAYEAYRSTGTFSIR